MIYFLRKPFVVVLCYFVRLLGNIEEVVVDMNLIQIGRYFINLDRVTYIKYDADLSNQAPPQNLTF